MFADFEGLPVRTHHVDTYSSMPQFLLRSLALPAVRRGFGRYIARNRIDVVFCTMDHLWDVPVAGTIRRVGSLYMLAVHDAVRHPGEDGGLRDWLLRRDVSLADGALTLTESVRGLLVDRHAFPRDRTWTAPLGSFGYGDRAAPRELPGDRPARLLFFGRILEYKGLDILLAAFPLLRAEFPELELEIWGTGDLAPYRATLAGLERVRVENRWIAEAEIPAILARTDLCVLPYREASQSAVVATAFADGMPVVATPIPGLREQIPDDQAGSIAAGVDPASLAAAIAPLLRDGALYRRLSAGALGVARTALDWEAIGDRVVQALRDLHRLGPRLRP